MRVMGIEIAMMPLERDRRILGSFQPVCTVSGRLDSVECGNTEHYQLSKACLPTTKVRTRPESWLNIFLSFLNKYFFILFLSFAL